MCPRTTKFGPKLAFLPGLAGSFGALLVVVARELYLARHLFTFLKMSSLIVPQFGDENIPVAFFLAFKLQSTIQWKSSTCHFLYVLACVGLRDKKPSNRFQRSTNPHGTSKYVYFTIPKHSSSSQPVYFPFLSLPDRKEECEPPLYPQGRCQSAAQPSAGQHIAVATVIKRRNRRRRGGC